MMAHTYTELLLNDESTPNGRSYNLYRVLTLTTQTYTESLLNDESVPDGRILEPISGPHCGRKN